MSLETDAFLLTDRVLLRRFNATDADLLVQLDSDPAVMEYLPGQPPPSHERAREWIESLYTHYYNALPGFGFWAAINRQDAEFLGWFHFRPSLGDRTIAELGYRLRRAAWGRGYATEVSRALIRKGFDEMSVRRVVATALADNRGSTRVMEKVGLRLVRPFIHEPSGLEAVEYALDREAFEAQHTALQRHPDAAVRGQAKLSD